MTILHTEIQPKVNKLRLPSPSLWAALLLFILLIPQSLISQEGPPARHHALVWQGFSHSWTYNHRLNRLGSYVLSNHSGEDSPRMGTAVHTAASGLGPDSAHLQTFCAAVFDSLLRFRELKIRIPLLGTEHEPQSFHIRKEIRLEEGEQALAVLNGFDLLSRGDADKLQGFRLSLDPIRKEEDMHYLNLYGELNMNCQSLECSWHNETNYQLDVWVLLICGRELYMEKDSLDKALKWTRSDLGPGIDTFLFQPKDSMRTFFSAIQSFSLQLNKAHWIRDLSLFVRDSLSATNTHSRFVFRFNPWSAGMKKHSYSPRHSFFSAKRSGSARFRASLWRVYLKSGNSASTRAVHSLVWKGGNRKADSPESVRSGQIAFPRNQINP